MLTEKVQKAFDYTPFGWLANGLESRFGVAPLVNKVIAESIYALGTFSAIKGAYEGVIGQVADSRLSLILAMGCYSIGVLHQHAMGNMHKGTQSAQE